MFIDTHAHLILKDFKYKTNPELTLNNSRKAGVKSIWLAGTNKHDNAANLDLCLKYPNTLKAWVGFHPEEYQEFDQDFLEKLLKGQGLRNNEQTPDKYQIPISNPKTKSNNQVPAAKEEEKHIVSTSNHVPIAGVGEVGLDLNWHSKCTLKDQQAVFEKQVKLAKKYNLPVCVHSRDATSETIEVMRAFKDTKFLWHCYNLDTKQTNLLLNKFNNIYFGFNAIITYKSGAYIMDSLNIIPNNKILLETDSPFLAPRPFKYNYNTPEGVISVYKFVAQHKNIVLKEFAKMVSKNAKGFLAV